MKRFVLKACVAAVAALGAMQVVPLAAPVPSVRAAELEVQASVDRRRVRVGETIMLSVDVIGTQKARRPKLDKLDGFEVAYLGATQKFSMVNGTVSSQTGHRFMLTATAPGRYKLGPFEVPFDGKMLKGGDVTVEVVAASTEGRSGPATTRPDAPDLELVLEPAKTEFWVGERVALGLRFSAGEIDVDGLAYPRLNGEGLTLDPFEEPARRTARVGGRARRFLDFETSMIAVRAGTFTLGPASIEVTVIEHDPRGRGRPFGGFSLGMRRRNKVTVESSQVEITVKSLPKEGRPKDFSGAVGSFAFDVEVGPESIESGDPVTIRTKITGNGNLSGVNPPAYRENDSLRAYDPLPAPDKNGPEGLVTEQIVIPRRDGVVELPALRFGYFDPAAGRYRTIERGPFTVEVAQGAPARRGVVFEPREGGLEIRDTPESLGRDIVYIKDRPGRIGSRTALVLKPGFAMGMTVPLAIYLASVLYARRRQRLAADPRIARFRGAGRIARKRLEQLASGADPGEAGPFNDQLSVAVADYLGAKLDLPPGAIDREQVMVALERLAVGPAAKDAARQFFERAERVRYAGAAMGELERSEAVTVAGALVDALETERTLAGRIGLAVAVFVMVTVVGLTPLPVYAEMPDGPPEAGAKQGEVMALFFEGNAAYRDGNYAAAAEQYEQALEVGGGSGELLFNLGNAYFKQSRLGPALLNYERARRLLPRDPDIAANRAFALETAGTAPQPTAAWIQVLFPIGTRATADELAVVALVLTWILAGLMTARILTGASRKGAGQAAVAMGLVLAFVIANLVFRLSTVELADCAIVISEGGAIARYEPSETGAEYFRPGEGETLTVAERRPGWSKVRRVDGVRGWVKESSLADL